MTRKASQDDPAAAVRDLIAKLGGPKVVAAANDISDKTVASYIQAGQIPARWFWVFRDMADRAGLPCPEVELFSFAGSPAPQKPSHPKKSDHPSAMAS